MKRRSSLSEGKSGKLNASGRHHGIVGVIGSIPFASTKNQNPKNLETLELHGEWEIIPAARNTKDGIVLYRVLRPRLPKKFEKSLKAKKSNKSA